MFLRTLRYRLRYLATGEIHSVDGYVGNLREPGTLGRIIRKWWWAIPIIVGGAVLSYLAYMGMLPRVELTAHVTVVPVEKQNLVVVDACHVIDNSSGRRFVAEDCLTFGQAAAGTVTRYPAQSVLVFVLNAFFWYMMGRTHQRYLYSRR